jgi:hypothetical protein
MFVFSAFCQVLRSLLMPRLVLATKNLALRQQLVVLHRSTTRPRLRSRDRLFRVALSHLWQDWRSLLVIVKPDTVIKWHRQGFKCCWRWKSRSGRVGRPRIDLEIRDLIDAYHVRTRPGECRASRQNCTCLGTRWQNQQWQSIGSECGSRLPKRGKAFYGIMQMRL